jgi:predicted nucleic-acid-binding Zn-ribbon protein
MRSTNICPKCKHDEVLFIPQLADRDDKDAVRPLVVHVRHFDWKDDMEVGKLQAYICQACGFTELYTSDAKSLPVDKIPGAQLLRGGAR